MAVSEVGSPAEMPSMKRVRVLALAIIAGATEHPIKPLINRLRCNAMLFIQFSRVYKVILISIPIS